MLISNCRIFTNKYSTTPDQRKNTGKVAVLYTRNIIDRYQLYREVIPK